MKKKEAQKEMKDNNIEKKLQDSVKEVEARPFEQVWEDIKDDVLKPMVQNKDEEDNGKH